MKKPKIINSVERMSMFLGRYANVKRFNHTTMAREEFLVDHITRVGIICMHVVERVNNESIKRLGSEVISPSDQASLFKRVLVHDMDEIATGDIPRTTKHFSASTKKAISKVEITGMKTLVQEFELPDSWYTLWAEAKEGLIGKILKLADIVSVVVSCYIEIYGRSNNLFRTVSDEVQGHTNELKKEYETLYKTAVAEDNVGLEIMAAVGLEFIKEATELLDNINNWSTKRILCNGS